MTACRGGPEGDHALTPPFLTTSRLVLRGHAVGDFAALTQMWSDPRVVRFIGGEPFTGSEVWTRLLRAAGLWPVLGFGYWLAFERAGGAFVGELGFADFRRDLSPPFGDAPEAGWALSPAMHGRGYAREALAAVHGWADKALSRRTVCMIAPDNARSIAVAQALGYRPYAQTRYRGEPTHLFERPPGG